MPTLNWDCFQCKSQISSNWWDFKCCLLIFKISVTELFVDVICCDLSQPDLQNEYNSFILWQVIWIVGNWFHNYSHTLWNLNVQSMWHIRLEWLALYFPQAQIIGHITKEQLYAQMNNDTGFSYYHSLCSLHLQCLYCLFNATVSILVSRTFNSQFEHETAVMIKNMMITVRKTPLSVHMDTWLVLGQTWKTVKLVFHALGNTKRTLEPGSQRLLSGGSETLHCQMGLAPLTSLFLHWSWGKVKKC